MLVDPEDVSSSGVGVSDVLPLSFCPGAVDVELVWDVAESESEVVDDDLAVVEVDEDVVEVGVTPMVVMADGVPKERPVRF
jgi:hypothetical protein